MTKEIFRSATVTTLKSILNLNSSNALANFKLFPENYVINTQPKNTWAQLELQYNDFQEAFCKLQVIAKTCSNLDYYPEIFNVYNRIVLKLYTK